MVSMVDLYVNKLCEISVHSIREDTPDLSHEQLLLLMGITLGDRISARYSKDNIDYEIKYITESSLIFPKDFSPSTYFPLTEESLSIAFFDYASLLESTLEI